MAKAADSKDMSSGPERNKAEHEDPIVELKDMPDIVPTPPANIQKTRGKGKHVLKRRKKAPAKKKAAPKKE